MHFPPQFKPNKPFWEWGDATCTSAQVSVYPGTPGLCHEVWRPCTSSLTYKHCWDTVMVKEFSPSKTVYASNFLNICCYASGVWHQNILGIWSKLVAKVFTVYGLLVTCKYTEELQHIGPKYSETLEKLQLLHRKFFYPNNLKRNFFPLRCKELSKVV